MTRATDLDFNGSSSHNETGECHAAKPLQLSYISHEALDPTGSCFTTRKKN